MVYKVIGIMSGSSLDGLDVAYVQIEEVRGAWSFQIIHAACIPFTDALEEQLRHAANQHVGDFLRLHTSFGRHIGREVNSFIGRHGLEHSVHFLASHGHTVFHDPAHGTTFQVGDGATIAAETRLPVICDLRSLDVALGGQGAPIVPIGDRLLFPQYRYLLNIGGIANMTINTGTAYLAYDVCPANQVLNTLAGYENKLMDENGDMAACGKLLPDVLDELNADPYYARIAPKSLSNEAARDMVFPKLYETHHNHRDLLHTMCRHIAEQVRRAAEPWQASGQPATMLVTGGGAFNTHLVAVLTKELEKIGITVVIPTADIVKFKESLIMALIGVLRWREEENVLSSVTGAGHDSIGGAIWMGR